MKLLLLLAFGVMSALTQPTQELYNFFKGKKQFASEVYTQLLKNNSGNLLVCPLSVDIVLALVCTGAKGQTAEQLSFGLHFPNKTKDIQAIFKSLASKLKGNEKYKLNTVNKMYVKDGLPILDSFKSTAVKYFDAEVQTIDFTKNVQAASEINKWVEDKTDAKIKDLIKSDELKEGTIVVLINALYFQGTWLNKFNTRLTSKLNFSLDSKNEVKTDFMQLKHHFNYYESSELKAKFLELPYLGNDFSMTIVLPNEVEGLSALENHIADVLVTPKYTEEEVVVLLPKFKIETSIEFKPILQALGVKDAFENSADFSGITDNVPLKISKVVQKAFIEVTEEGTTAAAATAVEMLVGSAMETKPRKQFTADHPFIFYLEFKSTIMFMGRYVNPN